MLRPVVVLVTAFALLAGAGAGAGANAAFLLVVPQEPKSRQAAPARRQVVGVLLTHHRSFKTRTKGRVVDKEGDDPNHSSRVVDSCWTRRSALTYGSGLGAAVSWALSGEIAVASSTTTKAPSTTTTTRTAPAPPQVVLVDKNEQERPNFNALLDLPPVPEEGSWVRLYLCRHGQTENNRLRKVQGARIDLPINENGVEQATNLGQALQRLHPAPPRTFFSSNLQRARLTAEIASSIVLGGETGGGGTTAIKVKQLDSLGEVDFGPVAEGRPVALAKAGMQATYAVWATGNIDFRPHGGGGEGESGREVLQRASLSIAALAKAASESTEGTCVAVTHSTFLRMLLAMALDVPLLEAATYEVVNGGVSVIDVPRDFKTRKNSRLFSGLSTKKQEEILDLEIPVCRVVRINETRHLPTRPILV